jgi:uncharacterized protein (TIGR02145 family)
VLLIYKKNIIKFDLIKSSFMKSPVKTTTGELIALFFLCAFFLTGCEKEKQPGNSFPESAEEIEKSLSVAQSVAFSSASIIENEISSFQGKGAMLDLDKLAKKIEGIDDVSAAIPSVSGTGIIVRLMDSTYINLLVGRRDDDRLFDVSIETKRQSVPPLQGAIGNETSPESYGKAIILAPFQDSFMTDLNNISSLLASAGYDVDSYMNENAILDLFRGSFLYNYAVIYIATHGAPCFGTWDGKASAILVTGEKVDLSDLQSLSYEELKSLALISIDGSLYYAITVPWLKSSTSMPLSNSWVYADASESSAVLSDPTQAQGDFFTEFSGNSQDISWAFMEAPLSAKRVSSWTYPAPNNVMNEVASNLFENLVSGYCLRDATQMVYKDRDLTKISWLPLFLTGTEYFPLREKYFINVFRDPGLSYNPYFLIADAHKIIHFNPDLEYGSVSDADNNTYKTIQIGTQTWMAENLRTTKFNDGEPIPNPLGQEWLVDPATMTFRITPAYCWYNEDIDNKIPYGALYNRYAVSTGKLCPTGWHVPRSDEITSLLDQLNGTDAQKSNSLKEFGQTHWITPWGSNESGFSALPGGCRFFESNCPSLYMGEICYIWLQDDYQSLHPYCVLLHEYSSSDVDLTIAMNRGSGCSVRCIKD